MNFCEAIARQEGWNAVGPVKNRCQRNNNPGDICYGAFAQAHGATGTDGRFAIFPDAATGFTAMGALLEAHYVSETVTEAVTKYAPPTENNNARYIADICTWTGLTPDHVLVSADFGI